MGNKHTPKVYGQIASKREKLVDRLIAQATDERLRRLADKCGQLSDRADDELYMRDIGNPKSWRYDGRAAQGLGVAHGVDNFPS